MTWSIGCTPDLDDLLVQRKVVSLQRGDVECCEWQWLRICVHTSKFAGAGSRRTFCASRARTAIVSSASSDSSVGHCGGISVERDDDKEEQWRAAAKSRLDGRKAVRSMTLEGFVGLRSERLWKSRCASRCLLANNLHGRCGTGPHLGAKGRSSSRLPLGSRWSISEAGFCNLTSYYIIAALCQQPTIRFRNSYMDVS